jgi:flagellar motor switch protein FliN/FliY
MAEALDVIVHLEAGRVNLNLSEWKKIKIGDFLFLDTCSLDPDEDKGRVTLTINGSPYFRARIKQGSIKILEHPLYHEANTAMDDSKHTSEDEDDIFSDDDLNLDSDEHTGDHSLAATQGAAATKDATGHDVALSGEHGSEHTGEIIAQQPHTAPTPLEEIPLPVVIELGRIQISMKKLLELQPGNMLDLNIHPEAGVDLVVNGKRIARGELLRIGEALGVRIQELS